MKKGLFIISLYFGSIILTIGLGFIILLSIDGSGALAFLYIISLILFIINVCLNIFTLILLFKEIFNKSELKK